MSRGLFGHLMIALAILIVGGVLRIGLDVIIYNLDLIQRALSGA